MNEGQKLERMARFLRDMISLLEIEDVDFDFGGKSLLQESQRMLVMVERVLESEDTSERHMSTVVDTGKKIAIAELIRYLIEIFRQGFGGNS